MQFEELKSKYAQEAVTQAEALQAQLTQQQQEIDTLKRQVQHNTQSQSKSLQSRERSRCAR